MPAKKQPKPGLGISAQVVIIVLPFKAGKGQPSSSGKNPGVQRAAPCSQEAAGRGDEAQGFGQPQLSRGSGADSSINPGGGGSCASHCFPSE